MRTGLLLVALILVLPFGVKPQGNVQRRKIVFAYVQCASKSERELLDMINGYTRVDSAYKNVVQFFHKGDRFQLNCYGCGASDGPIIKSFPEVAPASKKPNGMGVTEGKPVIRYRFENPISPTSREDNRTLGRFMAHDLDSVGGFALVPFAFSTDPVGQGFGHESIFPDGNNSELRYVVQCAAVKLETSMNREETTISWPVGENGYDISIVDLFTKKTIQGRRFPLARYANRDWSAVNDSLTRRSVLKKASFDIAEYIAEFEDRLLQDTLRTIDITGLSADSSDFFMRFQPVVKVSTITADRVRLKTGCSPKYLVYLLDRTAVKRQYRISIRNTNEVFLQAR